MIVCTAIIIQVVPPPKVFETVDSGDEGYQGLLPARRLIWNFNVAYAQLANRENI
jgi:hypothetical protein